MSKHTIITLAAVALLAAPLISLAQNTSSPGMPPSDNWEDGHYAPPPFNGDQTPPGFYYDGPVPQPPFWNPLPPQGTICTQEAMQCPDGTWVGRSGPNCDFICGGNPVIPSIPPNGGVDEAPYPGTPGNGGYIDWSPMWWNPFAESRLGEEPSGTICPQHAILCPDGSWAGPSGPNCDFVCGANSPQAANWLGDFFGNFFSWLGF